MRETGFNLLRNTELTREQKTYVDRFFRSDVADPHTDGV